MQLAQAGIIDEQQIRRIRTELRDAFNEQRYLLWQPFSKVFRELRIAQKTVGGKLPPSRLQLAKELEAERGDS